ncbi:MAG TPA: family 78 glycoside hydrolase catalytic domain [Opitutaceae bacterium]|nr:family 78 glycoside hydrolase catalytic domain [Opitutaceae bacterium]
MRSAAVAAVLSAGIFAFAATPLRVADPKCEFALDPLGVDIAQPRLSWRVASSENGQRQTAWQVLVASSPEILAQDRGDLWDSGRVASDETAYLHYAGKTLVSSQRVFWKVRSWDRANEPTAWSAPASWTMGLLAATDWKARWLVAPWSSESLLVRHEFPVKAGLRRALLHVCGLGQYEVSFNGARHGTDLLSPGWTNYNETTLYDTRDVTALLAEGRNAIGLTLGNGMYHVVRRDRFAKFTGSFGPLRAIAQLELEYADGSKELVATDDTWRVHRGAITYNSIYGGEDYDARLLPAGWNMPDFNDTTWDRAAYLVRPSATLKGMTSAAESLGPIETFKPVSTRAIAPGVVLYDFGQNASFMPRLRVRGPAGSTVRLTPGEVVNAAGIIDRGTMGGAHRGSAWWQYTKATDAEETWFPQFYYVGSRYVNAEAKPAAAGGALPEIVSVEAVVVHSTAKPLGHFATSNPLLNRIRDLVRWAQRSNMVSVLTDCPHREKLGWIEQYHLNGPSIRYEFDVARIYQKGMRDMAAAQTEDGLVPNIAPEYTEFKGTFRGAAEWGAAFILVPWQQYEFNGDTGLMREHFPAMKRYFAYLESRTQDGLLSDGLGDWYDVDYPKKGRAGLTPPPITATAFLFSDAQHLARIAKIIGQENDAKEFTAKAAAIRERYNQVYLKTNPVSYATGSQASLSLPLVMGLAEDRDREALLTALVKDVETRGYATAGDVGFRYLLRALADAGRSDVIYKLINQDDKPGYGYQLKQGATALTEAWDANLGASHNHFMLGQVIEWFYHDLAGIASDPEGPGFKKIVIRPQPVGDLTWVEASHESMHGPIAVRWERPAGSFTLKVTIPANTTATVFLPARSSDSVREGGAPVAQGSGVKFLRREGDRDVLAVESGSYSFEASW